MIRGCAKGLRDAGALPDFDKAGGWANSSVRGHYNAANSEVLVKFMVYRRFTQLVSFSGPPPPPYLKPLSTSLQRASEILSPFFFNV